MAAKKAAPKKAARKPEKEPSVIGQQLRAAIRESGLTLPGLAKAAGVDYAVLYRFTNGSDIRLETAGRIASCLKMEFRAVNVD